MFLAQLTTYIGHLRRLTPFKEVGLKRLEERLQIAEELLSVDHKCSLQRSEFSDQLSAVRFQQLAFSG